MKTRIMILMLVVIGSVMVSGCGTTGLMVVEKDSHQVYGQTRSAEKVQVMINSNAISTAMEIAEDNPSQAADIIAALKGNYRVRKSIRQTNSSVGNDVISRADELESGYHSAGQ